MRFVSNSDFDLAIRLLALLEKVVPSSTKEANAIRMARKLRKKWQNGDSGELSNKNK